MITTASATTTAQTDVDLDQALAELASALTAVKRGDPEPYTAFVSTAGDVTLIGAWGPIEQGHEQLATTFRWVASRFGPDGENIQDIRTIHRSGDLAVTVGFERGKARVDNGPIVDMVLRVTHVLRREDGESTVTPTCHPRTHGSRATEFRSPHPHSTWTERGPRKAMIGMNSNA
jgi:ketosteroid isomerase-like protein